jgi:hypothetical protein
MSQLKTKEETKIELKFFKAKLESRKDHKTSKFYNAKDEEKLHHLENEPLAAIYGKVAF